MKTLDELGKAICMTGCPENRWNAGMIKEYYKPLITAAKNLINTNRNISHPLTDICDILEKIHKAEDELIITIEEIENN